MAVEIKHSSTPSLSKGFYTVLDDLKIEKGHIIMPKYGLQRLDKVVQYSSAAQFLTEILPKL